MECANTRLVPPPMPVKSSKVFIEDLAKHHKARPKRVERPMQPSSPAWVPPKRDNAGGGSSAPTQRGDSITCERILQKKEDKRSKEK